MDVMAQIKQQIDENPVLLYMKGNPDFPQCGFSARVVQILKALGVQFVSIDVLSHPEIRANLPRYANWPTFPQLYVRGELVGGCDIVTEMYADGSLQSLFGVTA